MDSDDEMMFHQMTEELTALQVDDEENETVIRILVAAVEEEEAEAKRGGSRPGSKEGQHEPGAGYRTYAIVQRLFFAPANQR